MASLPEDEVLRLGDGQEDGITNDVTAVGGFGWGYVGWEQVPPGYQLHTVSVRNDDLSGIDEREIGCSEADGDSVVALSYLNPLVSERTAQGSHADCDRNHSRGVCQKTQGFEAVRGGARREERTGRPTFAELAAMLRGCVGSEKQKQGKGPEFCNV